MVSRIYVGDLIENFRAEGQVSHTLLLQAVVADCHLKGDIIVKVHTLPNMVQTTANVFLVSKVPEGLTF